MLALSQALLLDVGVILGLIIAGTLAVLRIRDGWTKSQADEATRLAAIRGDMIEEQDKKIAELEERITRLECRLEALTEIKAGEIAVKVVEQLEALAQPEGL